jgi:hypothetical protein
MTIGQSPAISFPASLTNKDLGWWTKAAKENFGEKSVYQWVITDDSWGAKAAVELINRGRILRGAGFIALGDVNGGPPLNKDAIISTVGIACNYNPRESATLVETLGGTSANLGTFLVNVCNKPFSKGVFTLGGYTIIPNESVRRPGKTGGFIIR